MAPNQMKNSKKSITEKNKKSQSYDIRLVIHVFCEN